MALQSKELERADCCNSDEHGEELIDKEKTDSSDSHEEPTTGPVGDYMTRLEVPQLMNRYIKDVVQVATTCIVTRVVKEMMKDVSMVQYDEKQEGIKTPIKNMVGRALTDIVEQCRLDTALGQNLDKLAK